MTLKRVFAYRMVPPHHGRSKREKGFLSHIAQAPAYLEVALWSCRPRVRRWRRDGNSHLLFAQGLAGN
jgi:hypothetical protein